MIHNVIYFLKLELCYYSQKHTLILLRKENVCKKDEVLLSLMGERR